MHVIMMQLDAGLLKLNKTTHIVFTRILKVARHASHIACEHITFA